MKVSLNIVKKLINSELPPTEELVKKINQQLGGVEEVVDLGERYKDALIVKVVSCEKHPGADKLSVCMIDDGGVRNGVGRDSDGRVQVVCGAPNVQTGMWAVWLPPHSVVPASYGEKELFILDSRELRGIVSHGMLAAGDELAINSDHEGIVAISEDDLPPNTELKAGASFANVFGLDDTIIDIENKMFTHRPDCFGHFGVAREIFAILQPMPSADVPSEVRFAEADWYWLFPKFSSASGLELHVFNEIESLTPRFMAVALDGVTVKPSPLWLQIELLRMGGKPINNVVDATNYIMLLTGQPTHAYDYEKLRDRTLGVRLARQGESVTLLNGKTYQLDPSDIVIVDGQGPVGLAGIMGGGNSEVSSETKSIVLEVATFDMYALRRSSMRHGLFTDALTRFNKGQSPLQNDHVLARLLSLIEGKQASDVFDLPQRPNEYDKTSVHGLMQIHTAFINNRLGLQLSAEQISGLLRFVNFSSYPVSNDKSILEIAAPFWRTDIEQPEDIVEEVGRLYGFDKLPYELPKRSTKAAPKNIRRECKQRIRSSLSRSGGNEVLTYSFVHENVLKRAEQDSEQAFRLSNALSPDLQYYRLTVLPSLLDKVHSNIKAGFDEFALFEIGKGHNKKYHADDDGGLPRELEFVDLVYTSKKSRQGAPYYVASRMLDKLCSDLGLKMKIKPITEPLDYPVTAPFEQSRSALVETHDGVFIGMVGELKQSVIKNFKLPQYVSAFTLDLNGLQTASASASSKYMALSKFPSLSQDISLKVEDSVRYQDVFELAKSTLEDQDQLENITIDIQPLSIYQSDDDNAYKTITFRLNVTSYAKTLRDEEVSKLIDMIALKAQTQLKAQRI